MLFYGLISLILILYVFKIWISVLNYTYRTHDLPSNVKDIYDEQNYNKWLSYTMEGFRFSLINQSVQTLVLLFLLFFKLFGFLERISETLSPNLMLQTLIFLGIYLLFRQFISIFFNFYEQFYIEEKYGFNKTTVKTFVFDQIKSLLLTVVLMGGLIYLLMLIYIKLSSLFFVLAWITMVIVLCIVFILNTKVFVKIFNKLTPLDAGELKTAIFDFVDQAGYQIKSISVMNASKRSTKLNAFFSGFGRFKEIVLFDTLIDKLETDEIVAVLAHEIAHGKHKDTTRMFLTQILIFGLYAFMIGLTVSHQSFALAFGLSGAHFGFGLILFFILIEPIQILLGIPLNYASRKAEFKADGFAAKNGYKLPMQTALKKLAKENYANLTPHPIYVFLFYSHPTISDRLSSIDNI